MPPDELAAPRERDDDAHEAFDRARVDPEDPYRHAPPGSPFSDD